MLFFGLIFGFSLLKSSGHSLLGRLFQSVMWTVHPYVLPSREGNRVVFSISLAPTALYEVPLAVPKNRSERQRRVLATDLLNQRAAFRIFTFPGSKALNDERVRGSFDLRTLLFALGGVKQVLRRDQVVLMLELFLVNLGSCVVLGRIIRVG